MSKLAKSNREYGKNEVILIFSAVVIAVIVLYWYLILSPMLAKLEPLQTEVSELKTKVTNIDGLEVDIKNKEKQLEELKVEYDKSTKVIPKTDRYPELIKEIRTLASEVGVTIQSGNLGKPTLFTQGSDVQQGQVEGQAEPQGLKTMSLNIVVTGDFPKVLAFIKKLEDDKKILEVQQVVSNDKSTSITLLYYIAGGEEKEDYDFNNGSYGKENIFN